MLVTRRRKTRWVDIDMAEMKLEKLNVHFAQSNKAEGKSPKTISWYSEMINDFIRFLEPKGLKAVLSDFTLFNTKEFIVYEQERGMSPYTVQGKVRALKAFSSWLYRENYISHNLLSDFKLPKVPRILIEPLTSGEIERLISYQNPLTAIGCRDLSIFVLMVDTGIRLGELCGLYFENVHVGDGYLKVMGKGSKERIVPIGAMAQKILWRYIFHFRPEPVIKDNDYLFLTLDGQPLKPNGCQVVDKTLG